MNGDSDETEPRRHRDVDEDGNVGLSFWLKMAGIGFAAWSIMLPLGIWILNGSITGMFKQFEAHVVRDEAAWASNEVTHADMNRRLYTLQAEHEDVKRRLSALEDENRRQAEEIANLSRNAVRVRP